MSPSEIFLLLILGIESCCIIYYEAFDPDARECVRLEEKVRRLKSENDQLLDQIQSLNQKIYEMSGKLYLYDKQTTDALEKEIEKKLVEVEGMTDIKITRNKMTNTIRITGTRSKEN